MAAWMDFVVIKGLGAALVTHSPSQAHIVPLAVAKSFVLVSVPAIALFLTRTVVSGMSFAIGVTALPARNHTRCLPRGSRGKAGDV
jgi:hypothetical protein